MDKLTNIESIHRSHITNYFDRAFQTYKYFTRRSSKHFTGATNKVATNEVSRIENIIGRFALASMIFLIKVKFIEKHGTEALGSYLIIGMNTNADHYHELDTLDLRNPTTDKEFALDEQDQWLVRAAHQLLKYGG